MKYLL